MEAITKTVDAFFTNPLVISGFLIVVITFVLLIVRIFAYMSGESKQQEALVYQLIKLISSANDNMHVFTKDIGGKLDVLTAEQVKTREAINEGFSDIRNQLQDNFESINELPSDIPHPCMDMMKEMAAALRLLKGNNKVSAKATKVVE